MPALMIAASACSSTDPPAVADAGADADVDAGPSEPAWQVVLDEDDLDRAVLSVWGAGPNDVFAVGGPLGNTGRFALALHYDGSTWKQLYPKGDATFWWVNGTSATDVWMVGEMGRIARWDGAAFTEFDSGTTATLWGVWAFSKTDAWAVGGTPEGGTSAPNDVVLHWDGASWTPVVLPDAPLGRSLYKVWGTSSDDLYVVGELSTIWHKKGATWVREDNPPLAQGTLFTVYGCSATEVYAVGGRDLLRSDGATWSKVDLELFNGVNGVSCGAPGEVAIVGFGGLKERLVDGAWIDDFTVEPYSDLHAVWADGQGSYWAAGGDFVTMPAPGMPRNGVIARYGAGQIAATTITKPIP